MKMRLQNDSVRLRVSVREVERLAAGQSVSCRTRFPGGAELGYRLEGADIEAMDANFQGGTLTVRVPRAQARLWAQCAEHVALSGRLDLDDGPLTLLVEKDFACLVPRAGEDETDRFVNPAAVTKE